MSDTFNLTLKGMLRSPRAYYSGVALYVSRFPHYDARNEEVQTIPGQSCTIKMDTDAQIEMLD